MSNIVGESNIPHSSLSQKKPSASWREHTENSAQGALKLLYSRKEAAFALGISLRALDYLLSRRSIKIRRIGARVLIHRDDLVKWASQDHVSSLAA
jgi:excisionase family DNA binding protein